MPIRRTLRPFMYPGGGNGSNTRGKQISIGGQDTIKKQKPGHEQVDFTMADVAQIEGQQSNIHEEALDAQNNEQDPEPGEGDSGDVDFPEEEADHVLEIKLPKLPPIPDSELCNHIRRIDSDIHQLFAYLRQISQFMQFVYNPEALPSRDGES